MRIIMHYLLLLSLLSPSIVGGSSRLRGDINHEENNDAVHDLKNGRTLWAVSRPVREIALPPSSLAIPPTPAPVPAPTPSPTAPWSSVPIQLKPLRYCSNKKWWGCKTRGYPYGQFWENAGMSNDNQDKAFFATMGSVPSRSNVEYIAIFSSGQQGSSGGSSGDAKNVVSGATDNYKWNTDENSSEPRSVQSQSVAAQFYNDQSRFLPQSKTLYLTLWDSQFNQLASSGEKEDTLNGYADYLNSKVYWSNIKGIVLVGSSRGGCLVMRLSQKLRSKFSLSSVDFAIASLDGVCKKSQSEFGTTSDKLDNPLSSAPNSYEAYETNMYNQFPSSTRDNHCVWHLATGDEVTGVGLGVRAFTHSSCSSASGCTLNDSNGEPFYTQKWASMTHKQAGREFSFSSETVTPILNHLDGCKDRFNWS